MPKFMPAYFIDGYPPQIQGLSRNYTVFFQTDLLSHAQSESWTSSEHWADQREELLRQYLVL